MLTRLAIATAPALFVVLWSTGFIGARYGMPYIEPLTFLALRMGFAVAIMTAIAFLADARRPSANEIGHSLVAGSLVHGLTLGGVFTAISQGVPAGISALILGLQPIATSTIANRFMGEKIARLQSVGLALGLVGVLLVLHDRNIDFQSRETAVRAFYYTAITEDQKYSNISPLIVWLGYNGYTVVTKVIKSSSMPTVGGR
jgi:drug/metabolite transporter (DMT)-like permease